ncbi:sulfate transporter family protein-like protein [Lophiostoma macrostomum CBS 122681]|uniref:Sulfate transporter family protein-like protein n=1 Tax=Lophiostoma macrostomum CBS 122681 TaxID=1314788 RepID=A0A6A6T3N6_9PLEO|nr:sulfate transporter family protein-like protein [Lophiostoma macrostomum CBS 122681]
MSARPARRSDDADTGQQLPFSGGNGEEDREHTPAGSQTIPRSRPIRAHPSASHAFLSSSYSQRTPARSFAHQSSHPTADTPQYSSLGVRERTQELASYALETDTYQSKGRRLSYTDSDAASGRRTGSMSYDLDTGEGRASSDSYGTDPIEEEDSEPESPETVIHAPPRGLFTSVLSSRQDSKHQQAHGRSGWDVPNPVAQGTETTPLLPRARLSRADSSAASQRITKGSGSSAPSSTRSWTKVGESFAAGRKHMVGTGRSLLNPKTYTKEAVLGKATASLQTLSGVFLGLLLNILDALSYGYILFPLGSPIFSQTGPDGISIFFVSCIVSQLCYSLGLSVFRGGVGSEMIEVVPFFHKMAYSIMARMEGESNEAVIATVIVSYCLSSVVTGLIFLALGGFKLGNLVSFFPRHILIGCIGGVGFFLFVTGIEVSARLEGNLNYDLETLHKLFAQDTVYLWILPLVLAVLILVLRRLVKSPFVLPAFFVAVLGVFYIIVKAILKLDLESARNGGWIFEKPEAGVPFYRFYTYFKFGSIDGAALASTIPTMFALSFFGIIHVPINVPALGAAVKEDEVNVNRELIAHGISNTISGLVGSIQNYLVYANSILFIANGGDSRIAGVLLALATTAVWLAGPAMIGYIPVCLVGALIFMLGIELMEEAVWDTFGKCNKLEYLTIIAIVLIMGIYDFVAGILIGIIMACLSYVISSSRTPAVRATYSGDVAESTVRRPRADRRYLSKVRGQIRVIKLGGFLFFGTIVSVEEYMKSLIEADNFQKQLTSFIVVDFSHVTDVDFSSSEGFQRINRILSRKNVRMIVSGISFSSQVGQALQNVGLLDAEKAGDDCPPPRVFEDLNTALEACENELLDAFYTHCSRNTKRRSTPPMTIKTADSDTFHSEGGSPTSSLDPNTFDPQWQSPRRGAQFLAAASTMREQSLSESIPSTDAAHDSLTSGPVPSKWKNFAQPIKIMLQTFEDVSTRDVDFWQIPAPYFERREYKAGTVLYSRGDEPDGFYILEKGRFRAEYELDQGRFYEVILPGTTCGELPFFSETDRTGTVAAENDSVAWLLTREKYRELEKENQEVASELLKVGLKLTKERMDVITSYVFCPA